MSASAFQRIALILLTALAVSNCAEFPALQGVSGPAAEPDAQRIRVSSALHQAVVTAYPPLSDARLQAYVDEVGQRLARHTPWPQLGWRFTVVDQPDVNAFGLPGGQVYLTRGLLAFPNSEAQLAALIAHEIGHIVAQHGAGALSGGDSSAAVLSALGEQWAAGYGRERELEASALGADYLARAGYDPQALLEVLGALKLHERYLNEVARGGGALRQAHHATLTLRAGGDARLRQVVEAARRKLAPAPRDARDYLERVVGLAFGDPPDPAVLVGTQWLHAGFGLAIAFPAGWAVRHDAAGAVATSPNGDAWIELLRGDGAAQGALQATFHLDAAARYSEGTLGGFPALFAAGTQAGRPLIAAAVMADGGPYLVAAIARDAAVYARERAVLRNAINSVRGLTEAERDARRSPVLQVMRADPGASMARLAELSPLGGEAETWLRLINALYPRGEPKPGQRIKIVR